jgi:hypothetical protein
VSKKTMVTTPQMTGTANKNRLMTNRSIKPPSENSQTPNE